MKKTKGKETESPSAESVEGITKIDFGVATTPAKKKSSKYPSIDGREAEELANKVIEQHATFKAIDGPFKATKKRLVEVAFPQFFDKNQGRMEAPSSMIAHGSKGDARVTFQDKYTAGNEAQLYALLTPAVAGIWFRQAWLIKIDGDAIPAAKAGAFVKALQALAAEHGASHAIEIASAIKPMPSFTEKRHVAFTPNLNLQINEIVPQIAMVVPA